MAARKKNGKTKAKSTSAPVSNVVARNKKTPIRALPRSSMPVASVPRLLPSMTLFEAVTPTRYTPESPFAELTFPRIVCPEESAMTMPTSSFSDRVVMEMVSGRRDASSRSSVMAAHALSSTLTMHCR